MCLRYIYSNIYLFIYNTLYSYTVYRPDQPREKAASSYIEEEGLYNIRGKDETAILSIYVYV